MRTVPADLVRLAMQTGLAEAGEQKVERTPQGVSPPEFDFGALELRVQKARENSRKQRQLLSAAVSSLVALRHSLTRRPDWDFDHVLHRRYAHPPEGDGEPKQAPAPGLRPLNL